MAKSVEKIIADTFLDLASALESGSFGAAKIILTAIGSEHGEENMIHGAKMAAARGVHVIYAGTHTCDGVTTVTANTENDAHNIMESMLGSGEADGAVTMHYPFPIGVSTVGRVITPAKGKAMYIATTTGTSSVDRVESMVKNTLYGIITAKACGVSTPSVGILNVDGAHQVEMALKELKKNGYDINFAQSGRSDGGSIMRGNDLLAGTCDIMVTDPLSGNILMKMLSSFTTGGSFESLGWGYGPGIGEGYDKLVLILSRASGAPVVAHAIEFAAELVKGRYREVAAREFAAAKKAKLNDVLELIRAKSAGAHATKSAAITAPPKEVVTAEISGIEIVDIEDAVAALWQEHIYAQSGMGCTGPIVMVSNANLKRAEGILVTKGYVGE
ncbi:MAG: glycine/sarcosine/betaine reductase complex component C subunit alpha [Oscillospiraceae bacterium]|nr:glycine/sarcosine/betaine reductase complex component C subunit alpha [Oscillospiraceae bacterium]